MVERRTYPDDQRISRFYMTDKAKALRRQAASMFRELDAEVAGALSTEEQGALKGLLLKVHVQLVRHMAPLHRHQFGWLPEDNDQEEDL